MGKKFIAMRKKKSNEKIRQQNKSESREEYLEVGGGQTEERKKISQGKR